MDSPIASHRYCDVDSLSAKADSTQSISMVADALRLLQLLLELESKPQITQQPDSHERAILRRYIKDLPNRFFEESSIDSTSRQLGIPRRTFTQLFHELTGETWLSHTRRLAVEHATTTSTNRSPSHPSLSNVFRRPVHFLSAVQNCRECLLVSTDRQTTHPTQLILISLECDTTPLPFSTGSNHQAQRVMQAFAPQVRLNQLLQNPGPRVQLLSRPPHL